jgi:hypothetical protein
MPDLPLGITARKRRSTWTPSIRIVNVVAESSDTNQFNGIDHVQRPGLVQFSTVGTGPIRGLFRQAGTFAGDFLTVSGAQWFRVDSTGAETLLGAVTGTGRTTAAATISRAIVTSDGVAYSTNGTTVTTVVMPDGRLVGSVAQLNGYFILTELNSARFYWIEPGQTDPDGLSFATTESTPGANKKVERVGDELWFFKDEGVEVWYPTGDADLPFQRTPGRNYDKGCRSRDTVVRFDNSVAWVGNDGIVYRGDNQPVRFSDNSIEEQIRLSTTESLSAWSYSEDGHTMYVVSMTQGTWAYDVSTQQWSEFESYNRPVWRAHIGEVGDSFNVAGDDELGLLYRLDSSVPNDNGEFMTRIVTGGVAVVGQPVRWNSLQLYAVTGTISDPNLFPKCRITWSDDGGQTYSDWKDVTLRKQGQYGEPVRINRLGYARYPGRLVQFQVTDDVVVTFSAASFNSPSR